MLHAPLWLRHIRSLDQLTCCIMFFGKMAKIVLRKKNQGLLDKDFSFFAYLNLQQNWRPWVGRGLRQAEVIKRSKNVERAWPSA